MVRIRKILVPTDFSKCADRALDWALLLARRFDAELHLVHAVVFLAADPRHVRGGFPKDEKLMERLDEIADAELVRLAKRADETPIDIRHEKRRGISASEQVLAYAQEIDADLIVMGTHGHRAPTRLVLGSVAEQVIRGADCPVLTQRELEPDEELEAIDKILVPIDFSDSSLEGLRTGRALAGELGAALQLLHVVEIQAVPTFYGPPAAVEQGDQLRKKALARMDELFEEAGGPAVPFDSFVVSGTPSSRIVELAEEQGSGLIVIPSHGLGGLEHWVLGSTVERVGRAAHCPVLTLKSGGRSLLDDESGPAA